MEEGQRLDGLRSPTAPNSVRTAPPALMARQSASTISRTSSWKPVRGRHPSRSLAFEASPRRRLTSACWSKSGSGTTELDSPEPHPSESRGHELADRMHLSGRDDVIVRLRLLKHEPHRFHILAGVPPVALRIQVARIAARFACPPAIPRHAGGDSARHKLEAAPGRFVVEQQAAGSVEAVGLPVIACQIEPGDLADPVRRTRVETGAFSLWDLFHLAEHLAGCRK